MRPNWSRACWTAPRQNSSLAMSPASVRHLRPSSRTASARLAGILALFQIDYGDVGAQAVRDEFPDRIEEILIHDVRGDARVPGSSRLHNIDRDPDAITAGGTPIWRLTGLPLPRLPAGCGRWESAMRRGTPCRVADCRRSDLHSTNSHGYSEAIFAVAHLLGISYAPRLKSLDRQTLYIFRSRRDVDRSSWAVTPDKYVNAELVLANWDDILLHPACHHHHQAQGDDGLGHFPPAQQLRQAARPLSRTQGFRPDYQVTVYSPLSR